MAISIVNTWQASAASYTYGTQQLTVTNSTGNWLFCIAQWENTEDISVVYVTDDAHNFWQPIICTTGTTGNVRTAVLVAQDAFAAATVSIASSGFIRNAMYTVIEVAGMQAGYSLDVTAHNESAGATSVNVAATTTQNDFILASAVQDTTANSITITGGGTAIPGAAVATLQTAMTWKSAAAGAQSITFTNSGATSAPWAAVLIAVRSDAPLPQNANKTWPVVACQAAFGSQVGDTTTYPAWTDITARFLGVDVERGRRFELDQLEAATVTVDLDNFDGAFNPLNSASPYYPNVKLMTPIRVLMTWQGHTYCLFTGHIEYLPQTYDFQRGIVQAECSDSFAKLPQVLLQSCMQQEILYDRPLMYFPLNEPQGAQFASNHSGRSAETFDLFNYRLGAANPTFGNSQTGLQGDTSNVFGTSGITNTTTIGSSLRVHDPDGDLPSFSSGVTIECWANLSATQSTSLPCAIITLEGNTPAANGNIIGVIANTQGLGTPGLYWQDAGGTIHTIGSGSTTIADGNWHHHVLVLTSTTYNYFFDGTSVLSGSWTPGSTNPHLFEIAGLTSPLTSYSGVPYAPANGKWAHVAMYDKVLDTERIVSHFNSGSTGFVNETSGNRIQRVLSYARWGRAQACDPGTARMQKFNYLGANYASLSIFGANGLFGSAGTVSDAGSQADLTIVDIANSENGFLFVDQNGALVYRQRSHRYNLALSGAYGDSFLPLNSNPYFGGGVIAPWTGANNATVSSGAATYTFSGTGSLLITPDGVTANPGGASEQTIPVTGSTPYTANAWLYSPQGWATTRLLINWYTSTNTFISTSSGPGTNLPPATPLFFSFTATAPSNAAFAKIIAQMTGTPASSVKLAADRFTLSATGLQAAYEGDISIDYDLQFLYNDITVIRNVDQASVRVLDSASQTEYLPRIYTRTVFNVAQNPPQDIADNASWLLSAYKEPAFRIARMTIDAASQADAWTPCLQVDVGDVIAFTRAPVGAPVITQNFFVVSVEAKIAPDVATFTYSLAPILNPVLTLDNSLYDALGPNSLGW